MKSWTVAIVFLFIVGSLGAEGQGEVSSSPRVVSKTPPSPVKVTEAVLEYADNEGAVQVYDAQGKKRTGIRIGTKLTAGESLATLNTTAEIRLKPNGTLVKLAEKTVIRWDSFQSLAENSTQVSLLGGKIRVVAARVVGANYQLRTQDTALGVRGTDFVFQSYPGKGAEVIVDEGKVEYLSGVRRGDLSSGQIWQSKRTAGPKNLGTKTHEAVVQTMDFKKLNPSSVPRSDGKTYSTLKLSPESWTMSMEETFDFFKIPDDFWTDEKEFFGDLESEGFFDDSDKFFD